MRPTLETWVGYDLTAGLQRVRLETQPLSEEETAELDTLEAEVEELAARIEDEDTEDDAREAAEARVREIGSRIDALTEKPPIIPDELKPRLGTFLLLDDDGRPCLDTSYYAEPLPEPETPEALGADQDMATGSGVLGSTASERHAGKPAGLSQAVADELAIQRRDILAVHVAADPALALDLAIFLMVDRGAGYGDGKVGFSLIAAPPSDPVFGFKTPDAAATRSREEAAATLDRSWTALDTRAGRFDAFRALPEELVRPGLAMRSRGRSRRA